MLKNQCGHSSLCVTAPEYVLSDENTQSETKEEDEDETNIDNNWSKSRRKKKKRLGNMHSSDEVDNSRNKNEVLKIH